MLTPTRTLFHQEGGEYLIIFIIRAYLPRPRSGLGPVGRRFGYWNLIYYRMNDIGNGKDSKVAKSVIPYEI